MDEMNAALNNFDNLSTTPTTVKETTMENNNLPVLTVEEGLTHQKPIIEEALAATFQGMEKEELITLLLDANRKMKNAERNYAKLYAAYTALKGAKPAVPTPKKNTRDGLAEALAALPTLTVGCGTADCPICKDKVKTNTKGRCIPCSNTVTKAFYASRYQK